MSYFNHCEPKNCMCTTLFKLTAAFAACLIKACAYNGANMVLK